jgi:hypothetical protein
LDTKPADPLLLREFAGTYLIRVDVDRWQPEFASVGIPEAGQIPAFFALDTTGKTTAALPGDQWSEITPKGLQSVQAFFQAHAWKQTRSPSHAKKRQ